jgi:transposase
MFWEGEKRRALGRRVEFLDFMNSVTAAFPKRQLHVILDNLNTHKKNEHWLKAHPNVQFHFTPTSASWLNQVEVWFSILQGQSLSGASDTASDLSLCKPSNTNIAQPSGT